MGTRLKSSKFCFVLDPLDNFRLEIDSKLCGVTRAEIVRLALQTRFRNLDERLSDLEQERAELQQKLKGAK